MSHRSSMAAFDAAVEPADHMRDRRDQRIDLKHFRALCSEMDPGMSTETMDANYSAVDADHSGNLSLAEFREFWKSVMVGRMHFQHIQLRTFTEVFDPPSHIIAAVVMGSGEPAHDGGRRPQSPGLSLLGVPWQRWLQGLSALGGTVLNVSNITRAFVSQRGEIATLLTGIASGTTAAGIAECLDGEADVGCEAMERDLNSLCIAILVVGELALVLFNIVLFLYYFSSLRNASPTLRRHVINNRRWNDVSTGFDWLEGIKSVSALKLLAQLKTLPPWALARFKLLRARIEHDRKHAHRELTAADEAFLALVQIGGVLGILLVALAGTIALHLKLVGLKAVLDMPVRRWQSPQFITFLGFANQISGLVAFKQVRADALYKLLFAGESQQIELQFPTTLRCNKLRRLSLGASFSILQNRLFVYCDR